jgi:hypothetical protein
MWMLLGHWVHVELEHVFSNVELVGRYLTIVTSELNSFVINVNNNHVPALELDLDAVACQNSVAGNTHQCGKFWYVVFCHECVTVQQLVC